VQTTEPSAMEKSAVVVSEESEEFYDAKEEITPPSLSPIPEVEDIKDGVKETKSFKSFLEEASTLSAVSQARTAFKSFRSVLDKLGANNTGPSTTTGTPTVPLQNQEREIQPGQDSIINQITREDSTICVSNGNYGASMQDSNANTNIDANQVVDSLGDSLKSNLNLVKAEDLMLASLKSQEKDWILYTCDEDKSTEQLEQWLTSNPPSTMKASSGVGWICIRHPSGRVKGCKITDIVTANRARNLWEEETKDVPGLEHLAHSVGVTSGKWLVHISPADVDRVWHDVATSMVNKSFGPNVLSAKVSSVSDESTVPSTDRSNKQVICIYNEDYTNMKEVLLVEKELRRLKVYQRITYKPDIYSIVGIYRNNKFGLKPTIYSSVYNKRTNESLIETPTKKKTIKR